MGNIIPTTAEVLEPKTLAEWITQKKDDFVVVDVRGGDFIGMRGYPIFPIF